MAIFKDTRVDIIQRLPHQDGFNLWVPIFSLKARRSQEAPLTEGEETAEKTLQKEHTTACLREKNALIEQLKLKCDLRASYNKDVLIREMLKKHCPNIEPLECPEDEEVQIHEILSEISKLD